MGLVLMGRAMLSKPLIQFSVDGWGCVPSLLFTWGQTMEVRNRWKGLDLIECLMNYGQRFMTLYRRQGARPSPRKKECKKAKWLSEEALEIAVKRREAKSKGEKERYTHLNSEFQRTARRDKKAFLSDECKEM